MEENNDAKLIATARVWIVASAMVICATAGILYVRAQLVSEMTIVEVPIIPSKFPAEFAELNKEFTGYDSASFSLEEIYALRKTGLESSGKDSAWAGPDNYDD